MLALHICALPPIKNCLLGVRPPRGGVPTPGSLGCRQNCVRTRAYREPPPASGTDTNFVVLWVDQNSGGCEGPVGGCADPRGNSAAHSLLLFAVLREGRDRLAYAKLSPCQLSKVRLNGFGTNTFSEPNPMSLSGPRCLPVASQVPAKMLSKCLQGTSRRPSGSPGYFPKTSQISQEPPRVTQTSPRDLQDLSLISQTSLFSRVPLSLLFQQKK